MSQTGIQVVLDLQGPDGNAFAVMAAVKGVLNKVDRSLTSKYMTEAMSGDYDHLLKTSAQYVDLIDSSNSYTDILGEVEIETTITRV
jgi:hypothetical protein